jgi:plasmid maintenance system antidote protein VapI
MIKNDLGNFITWLIRQKHIESVKEFATLTNINRPHLYKISKGESSISHKMAGQILSVFGKQFKMFMMEKDSEIIDLSIVSEDNIKYGSCKNCSKMATEIKALKQRINELNEMIELFRENKRVSKESKRAV